MPQREALVGCNKFAKCWLDPLGCEKFPTESETEMRQDLIPQTRLAKRLDITPKTLRNWRNDTEINFPKPVIIRARVYFRVAEIDEFLGRSRCAEVSSK